MIRESLIERFFDRLVQDNGGETRKVQWIGRRYAPDRFVMLPGGCFWVELKNPDTIQHFPATPLERGQAREHVRMRSYGQDVYVVGTTEGCIQLVHSYADRRPAQGVLPF